MRNPKSTSGFSRLMLIAILLAACAVQAQDPGDALELGFLNPPDSAKPRVWWHWMSGNITREGIKLDLEWMNRIGIGGFHNFDAALATPQIVDKQLVYMTPEWKEAFHYAATLADQLGLEMAIAGSPGWSETGGPWVPPAQAMKKLVWSTTVIEGGRPFKEALPAPPSTAGPFQNITREEGFNLTGSPAAPLQKYYADSAVIAYRMPDGEIPMAELHPKMTKSGGRFNLAALMDGDLAKTVSLPLAPANEKAWIQFEFAQPQTIRSVTLATGKAAPMFEFMMPRDEVKRELEASDDGTQFRTIITIPGGGAGEKTLAFAPVTARFFRVTFASPASVRSTSAELDDMPFSFPAASAVPADHSISELILHTGARVHQFEEKAAFAVTPDLYHIPTPAAPADWFSNGSRLWLDLGNVKILADVVINGKALGTVWKAPFRLDVTEALKPGTNTLEVKVTNLWVNRLIGDAQPDVVKKYTYTTQPFYRAQSPLAPSGLLGPVRITRVVIQ